MRPTAAGRRFAVRTKPHRFFWPHLLMEMCRREDERMKTSPFHRDALHSGAEISPSVCLLVVSAPDRKFRQSKSFSLAFFFLYLLLFANALLALANAEVKVRAWGWESTLPTLALIRSEAASISRGLEELRARLPSPSADVFKMSGQRAPASLCWNIQFQTSGPQRRGRRVGVGRGRRAGFSSIHPVQTSSGDVGGGNPAVWRRRRRVSAGS